MENVSKVHDTNDIKSKMPSTVAVIVVYMHAHVTFKGVFVSHVKRRNIIRSQIITKINEIWQRMVN